VYPNPITPIPLVASMTWNPGASFQSNAVISAASPDGSVNVVANATTDVVIDINGYYAAPSDDKGDTALGTAALNGDTTGTGNTAFGYFALVDNTSGANNTAVGYVALGANTIGFANTAFGYQALKANINGANNTAIGYEAMQSTIGPANLQLGTDNTALGTAALTANINGAGNTAIGALALAATGANNSTAVGNFALDQSSGGGNTALGYEAGTNLTTGNNNIMIGNEGTSVDDSTIRIGDAQTSTYIAGISGVGVSGGSAVFVNSNGQLGVETSSRRYKEDIEDMGDASEGLLGLRPVTFHYKKPDSDGSKPLEYGLIAEEVAHVYPELVVRGADRQIDSVQYQKLPAMLLNELQKEHHHIQQQDETIKKLEARLAALEEQLITATAK
jgi:Chaperone of endosialidase